MVVRPIDINDDWMPIYDSSQMRSGAEAVAQIAKQRLLFFQGEWWENEELGIGIPDFLANGVKRQDVNMLGKYLTSYIAETEGVIGVSDASIEYVNHILYFACVLNTTEGNASLEVDLSGLL